MNFTFNVAVILSTIYLAGMVEFAVWCQQALAAPEAKVLGE